MGMTSRHRITSTWRSQPNKTESTGGRMRPALDLDGKMPTHNSALCLFLRERHIVLMVFDEEENNAVLFILSKTSPLRYSRNIHCNSRSNSKHSDVKFESRKLWSTWVKKTFKFVWFEFFIRIFIVITCSPPNTCSPLRVVPLTISARRISALLLRPGFFKMF